ncbi:MAG: antitoxin [Acidobacteriota bacterium]
MRRLSIEMTPEQHQRLKAIAALHGKSIKEYVLERVLPPQPETDSISETEALYQLEMLLKPRIEAAERGETVSKSVEQIFEEVTSQPGRD